MVRSRFVFGENESWNEIELRRGVGRRRKRNHLLPPAAAEALSIEDRDSEETRKGDGYIRESTRVETGCGSSERDGFRRSAATGAAGRTGSDLAAVGRGSSLSRDSARCPLLAALDLQSGSTCAPSSDSAESSVAGSVCQESEREEQREEVEVSGSNRGTRLFRSHLSQSRESESCREKRLTDTSSLRSKLARREAS